MRASFVAPPELRIGADLPGARSAGTGAPRQVAVLRAGMRAAEDDAAKVLACWRLRP